MNRNERLDSLPDALIAALHGWQADLWTALPGIVKAVDLTTQTCQVQPTVQAQVTNQDGTKSWVTLPLLVDCPLYFPSGGGFTLTFPVAEGDECLVVFASRCIDAWWQSGKVDIQQVLRMHDLSDGFAYVGFSSTPRVVGDISATATQLRSDDGTTVVEVAAGQITLTAATVVINGDLTVSGGIAASGDVTAEGTSLHTHRHSGVQPGSGTTGAPV